MYVDLSEDINDDPKDLKDDLKDLTDDPKDLKDDPKHSDDEVSDVTDMYPNENEKDDPIDLSVPFPVDMNCCLRLNSGNLTPFKVKSLIQDNHQDLKNDPKDLKDDSKDLKNDSKDSQDDLQGLLDLNELLDNHKDLLDDSQVHLLDDLKVNLPDDSQIHVLSDSLVHLPNDSQDLLNDPEDLKDDPQGILEEPQDFTLHSNVQDGKIKDNVKKDPAKIHLCTICNEFKSNNLYIFGRHKKSCEKKFAKMWGFPNNSTEDPGVRDEIIKDDPNDTTEDQDVTNDYSDDDKEGDTKGQLISVCPFDVVKYPKKPIKYLQGFLP